MEGDRENNPNKGFKDMPPLTSSDESDDSDNEAAANIVINKERAQDSAPPAKTQLKSVIEAIENMMEYQRKVVQFTITSLKKNEGSNSRRRNLKNLLAVQIGTMKRLHQQKRKAEIQQLPQSVDYTKREFEELMRTKVRIWEGENRGLQIEIHRLEEKRKAIVERQTDRRRLLKVSWSGSPHILVLHSIRENEEAADLENIDQEIACIEIEIREKSLSMDHEICQMPVQQTDAVI